MWPGWFDDIAAFLLISMGGDRASNIECSLDTGQQSDPGWIMIRASPLGDHHRRDSSAWLVATDN